MTGKAKLADRHVKVLDDLAEGHGLFVRRCHREAADNALVFLHIIGKERDRLAKQIDDNQRDYELVSHWREQVEQAERKVAEEKQARRDLERRNTELERELVSTEVELDNAMKASDLEREHLQGQTKAVSKDSDHWAEECIKLGDQIARERLAHHNEIDALKAELDKTRRQRDRFHEKLSAVALNAKQIQVIVERGLTMLAHQREVADIDVEPALDDGPVSLYP